MRPALVFALLAACVPAPTGSGAAIAAIASDVRVDRNDALSALAAVAALTDVGGDLTVLFNQTFPQVDADAWADAITVHGARKVAGNLGDVPRDPCPWTDDLTCDEPDTGIGVCADDTDEQDCYGGEDGEA